MKKTKKVRIVVELDCMEDQVPTDVWLTPGFVATLKGTVARILNTVDFPDPPRTKDSSFVLFGRVISAEVIAPKPAIARKKKE
jgi:hypothetical protein